MYKSIIQPDIPLEQQNHNLRDLHTYHNHHSSNICSQDFPFQPNFFLISESFIQERERREEKNLERPICPLTQLGPRICKCSCNLKQKRFF
ncbi:hypothetical protein L2E82_47505 [Cichorium intybus]|uniref:Uncharacterized protein n=1 Tax=Cichorium intybus TaxID=13427 RepID=A0ACB8YZV2_CICIN|nr:hypothetical protein L2E82_47505 [Cichorium intybus]